MKREKLNFYQYNVDSGLSLRSVIVKSTPHDARTDAYEIVHMICGRIGRIKGDGRQLRRLPKDAYPVKLAAMNGEQWGWTV